MTQESQKRWPQVSSCCRESLKVFCDSDGTSFYVCILCKNACDAVADEGLEPQIGNSKNSQTSEQVNYCKHILAEQCRYGEYDYARCSECERLLRIKELKPQFNNSKNGQLLCLCTPQPCKIDHKTKVNKAFEKAFKNSQDVCLCGDEQIEFKDPDTGKCFGCKKSIENSQPKQKLLQWTVLKKQFREQQKELEAWNGRDYCKNCGTNYFELEAIVEGILELNAKQVEVVTNLRASEIIHEYIMKTKDLKTIDLLEEIQKKILDS